MKKLLILISGRGSNMEALMAARAAGELPVEIVAVISNRPQAAGLEKAAAAGIPVGVVDHTGFLDRQAFEAELRQRIDAFAPDLIVLAGFMRILTEDFVRAYEGRLMNIHPSLLPAFPGLNTHQRALDEGVRIHSCTVHFVTPELDHGPAIIQAAVPVWDDDDAHSLGERVLLAEHRVYTQAVRWFVEGRLRLEGRRVRLLSSCPEHGPVVLIAPATECGTCLVA